MKRVVLHIAPMPPQLGGMEAFAGHLIPALSAHVDVIVLNIAKPLLRAQPDFQAVIGYPIFRRSWRLTRLSFGYSAQFFLNFIRLLRYRRIDLIHIHTASYSSFWEKCLYILGARLAGVPIVLHIHGALFDQFYVSSPRSVQAIIRLFLNQCQAVIVLGENWQRFFAQLVEKQRIAVISNGIVIPELPQRKRPESRFTFLHLGEISERKGIRDLLQAFALVKKRQPDFILKLVGAGELEKARQQAESLGLQDNIELLGAKVGQEKWRLISEADVFVSASHAEGMPIALIEALAAGLPIIATRVGSVPEMLQDGRNGLLIDAGNVRALADAALTLMTQDSLRNKMRRENRALAQERYDIRLSAEKIADLYRNLLD